MEFVSVKVKVLSAIDQKTVNSPRLLGYVATDVGETFINIRIFVRQFRTITKRNSGAQL